MNPLRRQLSRLGPLLALLLLIGQSLAQVHATRHELASPASHASCGICILAHGAGGVPRGSPPPLALAPASPPAATALPARAPRQILQRPRSRAPPVLI